MRIHLPILAKLLTLVCIFFFLGKNLSFGQLLQQDFSLGNPLSQYVSATPNNQKFTAISTSGGGCTISAGTNALVFTRSANTGTFSRIADFSPVPTSLKYTMTLSTTSVASATSAAQFKVGAGFSNANTPELNTKTYSRIGIDYGASSGSFRLREYSTGAVSPVFSGTQTITWVLNNSGASFNYLAPNGSFEAVGNDKMDVWIGLTKVFNERAATSPALNMTDLKFVINGGNGSVTIDDIEISKILPTIVCPANASVNTDLSECSAFATLTAPVVTDGCDPFVITNDYNFTEDASDIYAVGETPVTWSITDDCGNTFTCIQLVTVTDNEAPTFTCIGDQTRNTDAGECTYSVISEEFDPPVADNCFLESLTWSSTGATTTSGAGTMGSEILEKGTTIVTWTADDGTSITTCTYSITISDEENPTVTCPSDVTVFSNASGCTAVVTGLAPASSNDNCAVTSTTFAITGATTGAGSTDASGSTFNEGISTVTYTVTDEAGNTGTCSFTVTVSKQVLSTLVSDFNGSGVTCNGATDGSVDLTVTGGTAPFTYLWSNGATTQDISAISAGIYSVTVTDANGCSETTSATITEPAILSASETHSDILCAGPVLGNVDITVTGGSSPYTYLWSNGATTEDLSGLTLPGTYNVTITDANGCVANTGATLFNYPVANLTTSISYATIQSAINDASAGDVIEICAGTFNERIVIDKSLTIQGNTETTTILDGTGLAGVGSGIIINTAISNVTIQNLTVKNFAGSSPNSYAGIYAIGQNNNLNVQNVTLKDNVGGSGLYANGPVNGLVLNNLDVSGHTAVAGAARGIVIWNGFKENITITNCDVYNNNCCGIELQDGTASGVTMTNNNVHDNTDNGLGLMGMKGGTGQNLIADNTITNNGRFGIEIKNPNANGQSVGTGSTVIQNNTVSFAASVAMDKRDHAGIAVFRRSYLTTEGYPDIPTGVVVTGNSVSGYQQLNPTSIESKGYGIVVEGTNNTVSGNTISNNDVAVQEQGGAHPNSGYVADASGDGDQSDGFSTNYFGRGNAPVACGNTIDGTNTYIGNIVNVNTVLGPGSYGHVTNTTTGETFCSIQAAINDAQTLAGHTIEVDAGTYNENIILTKAVTLLGANAGIDCAGVRGAESILSGITANGKAIDIQSDGVTINGFTISNPLGSFGIYAKGRNNTDIQYNIITDIGNNTLGSGPTYGISIEMGTTANTANVNITNNCVNNIRGGENNTLTGTPAKLNNGSGVAIGAGFSTSTFDITGLVISNNTITDITSCISDFIDGGKGAYGILINVGASLAGTGKAVSPQIQNNVITDLEGLWAHGVGLEGETPGATVQNNYIDDLTDHKGDIDALGVMVEENAGSATVLINNNSFTNMSFGIKNVTVPTVNGTCNWFGSATAGGVAAAVSGPVTTTTWLIDGTDNSASIGFQP
ncbi:MAG: right-handed parallel beta-helix repeat-containing protein, partial [Chitinophagales bacterium]|nr:right-handed parallel beta-helix repeat-containing protein [Chitinophagales bacterium]